MHFQCTAAATKKKTCRKQINPDSSSGSHSQQLGALQTMVPFVFDHITLWVEIYKTYIAHVQEEKSLEISALQLKNELQEEQSPTKQTHMAFDFFRRFDFSFHLFTHSIYKHASRKRESC